MGTYFLGPGGPRQGSLWSRDVSPIQGVGRLCVHVCVCMCVMSELFTAQWVLTRVSGRAAYLALQAATLRSHQA